MSWRDWWPWLRRVGRFRANPKVAEPEHVRRGRLGEAAAKAHLVDQGYKFLTANYRAPRRGRGEIDLILQDRRNGCLVFVEVKTRSREDWVRPAAAVDREKRMHLSRTAVAYLQRLKTRQVQWRFDIVEVLLQDGEIREIRHLPNAFPGDERYRFL
jgi:putative endonuclease